MYQFATIVLMGLAVTAAVNLVRQFGETSRGLRIFLDLVLGVLLTWATNYSMFGPWHIAFRNQWMGPVVTGLVIGGLATLWHEVLGLIGSYARRSYGEATEIEARVPHAA
jgi:hypothetical protein